MDEWLRIARRRLESADPNNDGKLTAKELDSPAGQLSAKAIIAKKVSSTPMRTARPKTKSRAHRDRLVQRSRDRRTDPGPCPS